MRTLNSMQRLAVLGAVAAFALAGVPGAYADHSVSSGTRSAVAGIPDGTSISVEGRLSILEFVYPGGASRERIYALVASDGTATRVAFAANANVRPGMSLVVSGRVSHGALVVQQHQALTRKSAAAAPAAPVSVEGTLRLLHSDQFDGGTSRFIWTLEHDDGLGSELDVPIAPTDMKPGMRARVTGTRTTAGIEP